MSSRPNILYVGSSWANRSFDTPDGSESDHTNLAKELQLDIVDLSECAASNAWLAEKIRRYDKPFDAIIWIYAEPIRDKQWSPQLMESYLKNENFWKERRKFNADTLIDISSFGKPVALIGGHSDIEECDHDNITVIHHSWQNFLSKFAKIDEMQGWGAEVLHREIMLEKVNNPSVAVVDKISETFYHWHRMELNGVFNWCHPNKKGTKLFANEISSSINSWIKNL